MVGDVLLNKEFAANEYCYNVQDIYTKEFAAYEYSCDVQDISTLPSHTDGRHMDVSLSLVDSHEDISTTTKTQDEDISTTTTTTQDENV